MIGEAVLINPTDALAIGLIVLTVVQIAKLLGMPGEWSPPIAVMLGGAIGIAAGFSNGLGYESWLSLFYDGATGGLVGIGVYSAGSGMANVAAKQKKEQAARTRAAKRASTTTTRAKRTP